MEPATWIIIGLLMFTGGEHYRAEHHKDRADELEIRLEQTLEVSEQNAQSAIQAAEVARNNADLVTEINSNLDQCVQVVEEYKQLEKDYQSTNTDLKVANQELEDRLADSDLSQCRVPEWLVDEVAGRNY